MYARASAAELKPADLKFSGLVTHADRTAQARTSKRNVVIMSAPRGLTLNKLILTLLFFFSNLKVRCYLSQYSLEKQVRMQIN